MEGRSLSLYIHIPFCIKKCAYCDFNSYTEKRLIPEYLKALKKEMNNYKNLGCSIKTIYVGGGTPTILDEFQLEELFLNVKSAFNVEMGAEVTIEANPGTLSRDKLRVLKALGVNRLSIGLQAYQPRLLKLLGRIHSIKDFEESYLEARNAGFENINVDVMFGLPEQSLKDFENTLRYLSLISPEHISAYSLSVEEGTTFYNMYKRGELNLPDEQEERSMYHKAVDFLKAQGYIHYEISNFAKPKRESRHNLTYWRNQEYLGLGAGSHSYFYGIRYSNVRHPSDYIRLLNQNIRPVKQREIITREEEIAEYCFLNLRLIQGLDREDFYRRFGVDIKQLYATTIDELKEKGLLEENGIFIKLTPLGLDLANEVFMEFLP